MFVCGTWWHFIESIIFINGEVLCLSSIKYVCSSILNTVVIYTQIAWNAIQQNLKSGKKVFLLQISYAYCVYK